MALSAGTVAAALTLETKGFQTGLDKAKSLIKTFQSDTMTANEKIKMLGTSMQGLGKTMTLSVTSSVIGLGTAAVKTFTGFDDAMRQVRATMNATADETEALTQAAKDAGATTRYSASEAAAALNYLALAGYDSTTAISALPDVLRLAQAGGMELAYTSDLLTDSMSALGKSSDYMTTFADQMTRASQRSNTSIAQLGEGILAVGGLAKNLAGDTVELNTVLGVLADNGIKGAEGGTHLRNILLALTAPEKQGAEALKNLGVSAVDSMGKLRPLSDVFADLNKAMATMTDAERTQAVADIFRTTDIASVNALLATNADRWTELGAAITDSTGAAKTAADTMEGGIGGAFRSMKSAVEAVAVEFGENLAPMVQSAAEWVTGLARSFAGLSESTQNMILRVAAFAAAAGPALIVLGKLTTAAGTLMKLFSGPAGWVMLGVGAVGALVIALKNARQEMNGFTGGFADAMASVDQEKVDKITAGYEVSFSFTGTEGRSIVEQFRAQLPSVYDAISTALTDGKPDDAATMAALEQQVRDYYAGQISVVENWANEEIAKLDVNSATYDTDVANIQAKAAELVTTLRNLETESLTWITNNAGRSTATVQARLGELDAIEARARETLGLIDEVVGAEAKMYENRVDLVKRGVDVSDENVGTAIGWERGKYERGVAEVQAYAEAEREKLYGMADQMTDEDFKDRMDLIADLEADGLEKQKTAYLESLGEIAMGIDKANGGVTQKAKVSQELLDELDLWFDRTTGDSAFNWTLAYGQEYKPSEVQAGMSDELKQLLLSYGVDVSQYSDTSNPFASNNGNALNEALNRVRNQMIVDADNYDWGELAAVYKAVFQNGAMDGLFPDLDLSNSEDQLAALFRLLPEAAAEEIEAGTPEVVEAAQEMTEQAAETAKTKWESEPVFDLGDEPKKPLQVTGEAAKVHYEGEHAVQEATEMTAGALWKYYASAIDEAGRLMSEESFVGTDGTAVAAKMSESLKRVILEATGFSVDALLEEGGRENGGTDLFNALFGTQDYVQAQMDALDPSGRIREIEAMFGPISEAEINGIVGGLQDGTPDVEDANTALIEAGVDAAERAAGINSPSRVYRQLGVYTVEGLILGLEDKRSALLAKARELAQQTAAEVREALDIHSPSKLFRGFGRNTAEGFALGIDDGMFRTEQALGRLTGFTPAGAGAGSAAPVINITLPNATVRSDEDARTIARNIASYINKVNRGYGG